MTTFVTGKGCRMSLQKFISVLVAVIGLIGFFLISRGILAKPRALLDGTSHYSAIAWLSPQIIDGLSGQKANLQVGSLVIIVCFFLQIFSALIPDQIMFTKNVAHGVGIAIVLGVVLYLPLHLVRNGLHEHCALQVKKQSVVDYFHARYQSWHRDSVNVKGVENISKQYFDLPKSPSESWEEYILRIATYVEWELPSDLDLNNIKEPN
jgi:hypothetical protein